MSQSFQIPVRSSKSWQNILDSERKWTEVTLPKKLMGGISTHVMKMDTSCRLLRSHPVEHDCGWGGVLGKTERVSVFFAFCSDKF